MHLRVEVDHIQHVDKLALEVDLAANKLTCIVGRNGIGKTTLIKAIRNLAHSDTFLLTASRGIFASDSSISYYINGDTVRFTFDSDIDSLNCKARIPDYARKLCAVELPMPYGERFNFFQSISHADRDIRRQLILEEYVRPTELIDFLTDIYSSTKFESLVETKVRGRSYYSILLSDSRYVREDYLSSGEYFLINLYRTIKSDARLIVVDEIDLSLDAAAQVHLLRKLREFCRHYNCNILFTTHSLAMMRTLDADELMYMERRESEIVLSPASYSYIKTLLFGFTGWDRYILTEDRVLHGLLEFIIQHYCRDVFYQYKIIYVGGGSQVSDLMRRNREERFLSEPDSVLAVLDGDQRGADHAQQPMTYVLPIESVEKALSEYYAEESFPFRLPAGKGFNGAKDLFNSLQRDGVMSILQIYAYICERNEQSIGELAATLSRFLSRNAGSQRGH